jgi:hypothetical protein
MRTIGDWDVETKSDGRIVAHHRLAGHEAMVTLEEVLGVAYFALTNTDLAPDDPRHAFLRAVQRATIGPGWSEGKQRIVGGPADPELPRSDGAGANGGRTATVAALLLVTDVGAQLIDCDNDRDDQQRIAEAAADTLRYNGAHAIELRPVQLIVPLLPAPMPVSTSVPATTGVVDPEILATLERARADAVAAQKHARAQDIERLQSLLTDILPSGRYEFTNTEHSRGLKRIPDDTP